MSAVLFVFRYLRNCLLHCFEFLHYGLYSEAIFHFGRLLSIRCSLKFLKFLYLSNRLEFSTSFHHDKLYVSRKSWSWGLLELDHIFETFETVFLKNFIYERYAGISKILSLVLEKSYLLTPNWRSKSSGISFVNL